jgi:hypothetical protein
LLKCFLVIHEILKSKILRYIASQCCIFLAAGLTLLLIIIVRQNVNNICNTLIWIGLANCNSQTDWWHKKLVIFFRYSQLTYPSQQEWSCLKLNKSKQSSLMMFPFSPSTLSICTSTHINNQHANAKLRLYRLNFSNGRYNNLQAIWWIPFVLKI